MNKINTSIELSRKVDVLNRLQINTEAGLLVINANGISENEHIGEPKLILTKSSQTKLTDGILEFNFVIQGGASRSRKKLAWNISVVYRMDILPQGIKAIKVNATQNADIAFLPN